MSPGPEATRPEMPRDYGIHTAATGLLPWPGADERLAQARNYWVATTRPDARPHAMPVWGVWLEERLWIGTDRRSRKARNLAANPAVAVHLESGDDVVIVEGWADEVTDAARLAAVDDAYLAKYGMRLRDAPGELVVYGIRPDRAFGWREKDFPASATRWRFGEAR